MKNTTRDISYWINRCKKAEEKNLRRESLVEIATSVGIFMIGLASIIAATNFAHLVR